MSDATLYNMLTSALEGQPVSFRKDGLVRVKLQAVAISHEDDHPRGSGQNEGAYTLSRTGEHDDGGTLRTSALRETSVQQTENDVYARTSSLDYSTTIFHSDCSFSLVFCFVVLSLLHERITSDATQPAEQSNYPISVDRS